METESAEATAFGYKYCLVYFNENDEMHLKALTILAKKNIVWAEVVVRTIMEHLETARPDAQLPVLYVIDSIIRNVGGDYLKIFSQHIMSIFVSVYQKVDEPTRALMYELRQRWSSIFSSNMLYSLDARIKQVDPAWRITSDPLHAKRAITFPGSNTAVAISSNTGQVTVIQENGVEVIKIEDDLEQLPVNGETEPKKRKLNAVVSQEVGLIPASLVQSQPSDMETAEIAVLQEEKTAQVAILQEEETAEVTILQEDNDAAMTEREVALIQYPDTRMSRKFDLIPASIVTILNGWNMNLKRKLQLFYKDKSNVYKQIRGTNGDVPSRTIRDVPIPSEVDNNKSSRILRYLNPQISPYKKENYFMFDDKSFTYFKTCEYYLTPNKFIGHCNKSDMIVLYSGEIAVFPVNTMYKNQKPTDLLRKGYAYMVNEQAYFITCTKALFRWIKTSPPPKAPHPFPDFVHLERCRPRKGILFSLYYGR